MEYVRPYLAAPGYIRLLAPNGIKLLLLFLQLAFIQFGTEHRHRTLTVFDLGAFILTRHDDSGRNMRNPYSRVCRIDMLTTGTTGTVRIDFQILCTNLDINIIRNFRYNVTGYKGSVSSA
ncbi:hypothetical protein D3C81_1703110 [compost metagenome]